ncbi:MAG: GTP-binding protein [Puniceicoccaceae bacterium 5H]|nr:MAG: GTP-binding protein [Puniceicoccaceae bacterium 5H]
MFIDECTVKLRAGNGGHGSVSFRREKFVPKGGPDGGNGGKGGDVVLECDENVSDLRQFYYKPHWEADNGNNGGGRNKDGRGGKDCVLKVPPGLVIISTRNDEPVTELLEPGSRFVLLKGGMGGRGNTTFKSSTNRTPQEATDGDPGQHGEFRLVLKTIADVGLVGFPNAGKSTLVNMITAARPKMGAYPFTTLNPSIGVVEYPERYDRLKLADIPGLIKGAHENRGLGHRFLRHIERCQVLVFIIDMAGTDERDPVQDYRDLVEELEQYDPALSERPRLVAANKMDEPAAAEHLKRFAAELKDVPVQPVSCLLEEGLPELKEKLYALVKAQPTSTPDSEA